jgi:hypothetical protein
MTSPTGGGAGAAGAGSGVGGGMSAPTTSYQESPSSSVVPETAPESLDSWRAGRLPGFAPTGPRTWTVFTSSLASVAPGAETAMNAAATTKSTTRVTFSQRDRRARGSRHAMITFPTHHQPSPCSDVSQAPRLSAPAILLPAWSSVRRDLRPRQSAQRSPAPPPIRGETVTRQGESQATANAVAFTGTPTSEDARLTLT